jgi:hypothetical protein
MSAYLGLSLTMLATLLLEIVDSRLLSVVTWYHLSFVAISVAMLGAAAGAVAVFVSPARFPVHDSPSQLATWAGRFAIVLPISHLLSLVIPMPGGQTWTAMDLVVLALALGIIATPFALGGVVTTLALTRTHAPVGRLYAADLFGAALGCLAAVALLDTTTLSSAAFAAAACAALGALAFRRAAGRSFGFAVPLTLVLALVAMGVNVRSEAIRVLYPKNRLAWSQPVLRSLWNSHAHILAFLPSAGPAFYWGGGDGSEQFQNSQAFVVVDGEAATPMTEWDGNPASLDWVSYDVTALPYHLRKAGTVGIIGVGGGATSLRPSGAGARRSRPSRLTTTCWRCSRSMPGASPRSRITRAYRSCTTRAARISHARPSGSTCSRCRSSTRGPRPARARSRSARTASTRARRGGCSSIG